MVKILNFKHKLSYYLNLIDARKENGDLWGVLDACRNALNYCKLKAQKQSIEALIGQTYFEMGLNKLACEHFYRALKVPEMRASAFFGIGRSLVLMNKFDLALEYFDTAIQWDYNSQFQGVILEWINEIKIKINNPLIMQDRLILTAKNLIRMNKFNQAEEVLKPLLKINQKASNYYSLSLLLKGDLEQANYFNNENLKDKNNFFAICLQYEIDMNLKLFSKAETTKNQIKLFEVKDADNMLHKAMFFAQQNDYETAFDVLQKAQNLQQYIPKLYLYCAISAYNIEKIDDALYFVSRARWLDFENPIYNFYYDVFKKQIAKRPVVLSEKFIEEFAKQKIDNVKNQLKSSMFVKYLEQNHFLLEDLTFSFLNDNEVCDKASKFLANSSSSLCKNLFANLLLSAEPNLYQKFLMCRQVFAVEKIKQLDMVCNYRYISVATKKYSAKYINNILKNSVYNALAYSVCYSFKQEVVNRVLHNANIIQNSNIEIELNENELTCYLFFDNTLIFQNACIFFGVEPFKVIQFKNLLKLTSKR